MARIAKWEFWQRLHEINMQTNDVAISCGIGLASAWQVEALRALNDEYEHSISLVARRPTCPNDDYNCFEFAFGISPVIGKFGSRLHPTGEFADILIRGTRGMPGILTECAEQSATVRDIILYGVDVRNPQTLPEHAGILVSAGTVVSKWGLGDLWMHGVEEVPSIYGTRWAYFVRPDPGDVQVELERHARRCKWIWSPTVPSFDTARPP